MIVLLFWFANSLYKRTSALLLKSFFIIVQKFFHPQVLSILVFTLHSIAFNFLSCFIMITNSRNVFMNGLREDGEGK
jgi:hypothetical protein